MDLGWGPKYTIPAYKHYNLDGVDEIQDDSNRYLVYGINQDGEKNWYNFDYDKNSLQLFDRSLGWFGFHFTGCFQIRN